MAGRNATGPLGMGPQTGRGFGRCGGESFSYNRHNSNINCRRGRGFGRGIELHSNFTPELNEETLMEEKRILEDRLKNINQILDE